MQRDDLSKILQYFNLISAYCVTYFFYALTTSNLTDLQIRKYVFIDKSQVNEKRDILLSDTYHQLKLQQLWLLKIRDL